MIIEDQRQKLFALFVGYNKNSKIATLSLNVTNNKYCCSRCGVGGYSIGLYAKLRNIDTKKAYKELLDKECFSINKSSIVISPINEIVDIDTRDLIYREFLNTLKLEPQHRSYLQNKGFLNSTIDEQLYRSTPKKNIKRRLICNMLKRKYDLSGVPGFYQDEDWCWNFASSVGFFVPLFDENNKIQALSIHLDKPFNDITDLWFSSNGKVNGTGVKNWISKSNINQSTDTVILTDNLILGNYIKAVLNAPVISFLNINNSYQILKAIDNTNIQNIIFALSEKTKPNLDYIIRRIFRDLIPIGYNIDTKCIIDYNDILKDDFMDNYKLKNVS